MRDEGARFVFPHFTPLREDKYDTTRCLGARALEEYVKVLTGNGQRVWHDFRRGVEHAMDLVPRLPEETGRPATIALEVKNAVTLRSNLQARGSRDTYIHDIASDLFAATRYLHLVRAELVGGMVAPDGDGVARAAGDAPFEGACGWCDKHLSAEEGEGSMCDHDGCLWTLCRECWAHPPSAELWCPEHEPDTNH